MYGDLERWNDLSFRCSGSVSERFFYTQTCNQKKNEGEELGLGDLPGRLLKGALAFFPLMTEPHFRFTNMKTEFLTEELSSDSLHSVWFLDCNISTYVHTSQLLTSFLILAPAVRAGFNYGGGTV